MTTQDTLASIQAMARTIHEEIGVYVTYIESMHPTRTSAEVWIQLGYNDFDSFKGCDNPSLEQDVSLEIMRDRLRDWLVDWRHRRNGEVVA